MREVQPLGILSVLESQPAYAERREEMSRQTGALGPDDRRRTAEYMRRGSVVLAIMEYTTDILGTEFGVPGGSGILTDGEFYWRGDAADYVEHYGVTPGDDFLRRVAERHGVPPALTLDEIIDVDDYLSAMRRRPGPPRSIQPAPRKAPPW
ncbi:hypothetical protein [Streptomyces sp. NPDC020141]|uniref:hypothetical protein n=1 Tax=Streptomyces sp. NPDC020141 TaxID=3365065 RepID=UPI0037A5E448